MRGPRGAFIALFLLLFACSDDPQSTQEGRRETAAKTAAQTAAQRAAQTGPACTITRVIDGDTVAMACRGLGSFRARLMGHDTPETYRARCRAELALGQRATARLRQLLAGAEDIAFSFHGTDRYGRMLTRLRIDGRDVGQRLISEGLAVQYSGGRRIDWCAWLA